MFRLTSLFIFALIFIFIRVTHSEATKSDDTILYNLSMGETFTVLNLLPIPTYMYVYMKIEIETWH